MNFIETEKAGLFEGFALVKACDKKNAKNGTFYLDMKLGDKESEMTAKLWDFKEENTSLPEVNTVVKVRGTIQQYNGNDQFIIQRIRPATEDEFDMADFVKTAEYSGNDMLDSIIRLVNDFEDEELKMVVLSMLRDNQEKILTFPAAEKLHHAMTGGLLYHTLSIVRLAECVGSLYPCVDRELLLSGAILHDIAKMREYTINAAGIVDGYTAEGVLLGHLIMGAEDVGRKCDELEVKPETKYLLQHMLASHHGKREHGAAIRPLIIEAEILSQLDLLDANLYEMAEAIGAIKVGEVTKKLWMLDDRRFFNHGRMDVVPKANVFNGEE